ncbi:MAG: chorismate mutase [Methanoculleaceae archaeon]
MPLAEERARLEEIDARIIDCIRERQEIAARLARIKHKEGIPIEDPGQRREVLNRAFELAVEANIDPVAVRNIFGILVSMSEERQRECLGGADFP